MGQKVTRRFYTIGDLVACSQLLLFRGKTGQGKATFVCTVERRAGVYGFSPGRMTEICFPFLCYAFPFFTTYLMHGILAHGRMDGAMREAWT